MNTGGKQRARKGLEREYFIVEVMWDWRMSGQEGPQRFHPEGKAWPYEPARGVGCTEGTTSRRCTRNQRRLPGVTRKGLVGQEDYRLYPAVMGSHKKA